MVSHSSWWGKAAAEVVKGRGKKQQQEAHTKATYGLLAELKSCSLARDLEWGRRIHAKVFESELVSSAHVATALVNMYAKCRSMVDARQVFDSIKKPSVVSWTALLFGYADNGEGLIALNCFSKMKSQPCTPNSVTYVAALKACASLALKQGRGECLERGKRIHSEIGQHLDLHVQNTLIDMYAKGGSMEDARQVFDSIAQPSLVSWNALLAGYAEHGEGLIALDLFSRMKSQGCVPDFITYVAALKACASLALKHDGTGRAECLERGRRIHSEIGCYSTLSVQTNLIDMYAKCGSMVDAHHVFECIRRPDTVSWTVLLSGYADCGEGLMTLDLFARMKAQGCAPDSRTYVAALKACACLAQKQDTSVRVECLERGKQIHLEIGCHMDNYVQNTLIDMYAKCGSMAEAHLVFNSISYPDVVAWNALLLGYVENGQGVITLDLFWRMKSQGYAPDPITYMAALKACSSLAVKHDSGGSLAWGKQIHLEIGCHSSLYVQTTLVVMYAKCGSMNDAHQVFNSIEQPSVVSWNALLLGYAGSGEALPVLDLFLRMKSQGCLPDSLTYVAALKACGLLGALEFGRKIHAEIGEIDAILVTCLVDFYAKCGSLVEARKVFDLHSETRDLTTWTALLTGYSSFGETDTVLGLFQAMQDGGLQPDGVTIQCILMCYSHAGLIGKARECFQAMPAKYGVTPGVEHYTCLLDVLGRANKLDDAIVLLGSMPCSPNATTWMTVLGACCKWKHVEIGRLAFLSLVSLDEGNASAYVLMAHIYASRGMWEEQAMVLGMRKPLEAPGQTCLTSQVHRLLVGDNEHPQVVEKVEGIIKDQHGYVTDDLKADPSLKAAEKEEVVCDHAEKLTIACALINTKHGEAIRIVKHTRVCDDCHKAAAIVSKLEARTILFRDASKLHVFKDGECSCGRVKDAGS